MRLRNKGEAGDRSHVMISLIISAIVAAAGLVLIVGVRSSLEEAVSGLANLLPVGYAFAAGMVASVNPCGALMLPSYIFFQLGARDEVRPSGLAQTLKGVRLAIATTAGFAVVFGLVGAVVSIGGRWLAGFFPYAGLVIGLAMVVLGIWLLTSHRNLGILAATRVSVTPERSLSNMFLFGVAYAVGSLGCSLPIFLVVVGSALAAAGWMTAFVQFIGYALGMGAVMTVVAVGTSLFQQAVERWLRRLLPYVHRVSALFLVGSGIYLIYYWISKAGLPR